MTIDRHLTVGDFPHRPRILPGHPDRVAALFLKACIIKDQHPIPGAGQGQHLGDPLPVEGLLIPDHVGQQVLQLLLAGLWHDLRQGVTVFVGMLTEQPGHILAQGLRARPLSKLHPQRGQELCQLRQRGPRGLGHPLLLRLRLSWCSCPESSINCRL